jgi:hypothetical protein
VKPQSLLCCLCGAKGKRERESQKYPSQSLKSKKKEHIPTSSIRSHFNQSIRRLPKSFSSGWRSWIRCPFGGFRDSILVPLMGKDKKQGSKKGVTTNVYLNIYDLTPFNNYLYWFGLGIFHSGIEGIFVIQSFFFEEPYFRALSLLTS